MTAPSFDIPKECKAGVVVDEGPNFRVEVKMVPVPEIGNFPLHSSSPESKVCQMNGIIPSTRLSGGDVLKSFYSQAHKMSSSSSTPRVFATVIFTS